MGEFIACVGSLILLIETQGDRVGAFLSQITNELIHEPSSNNLAQEGFF